MDQKFIPLSVPNLKGNELKYVAHAVETEWVSTGGPYVSEFENVIAKYVKAPGAVSCQNGTSGLHISLILCGVTKEDEVIVPALTFIAAVNPVRYIGAEPVFMDCDDTLCLDPDKLLDFCQDECSFIDEKLIDNTTKKHIKAVVVVHVFGNMANMEKLMIIANQYNLLIIEDATEALGSYCLGGKYKGRYAGTIGAIGVYSFNGNKIITTGGGGMIVSNNEDYLKEAHHLTTQAKSDEINFIHDEVGYNYRMTNLQAALGLAQMEQLEGFIHVKDQNFQLYKDLLSSIPGVSLLPFRKDIRTNYWFYSLYLNNFALDRDEVISEFLNKKIQTRPIWGLINNQKPYGAFRAYKIEKAKNYRQRIVNIPCSTNLNENDIELVVSCLKEMVR